MGNDCSQLVAMRQLVPKKLSSVSFFLLFFPLATLADVVQSKIITFPENGRVVVQAHEDAGKYPRMVFVAKKTGRVLFENTIRDGEKWLLFDPRDVDSHSQLRFREITSSGFKGPIIMSVGVMHGGSDDAFFLTLFGEYHGKLRRLNSTPIFANTQGGYFVGHLNKRLGFGLACWNFIWGHEAEESHYSLHRYGVELYELRSGRFQRVLRANSKKMYHPDKSWASLREFGVAAHDQRVGVPVIRDLVQVSD
jgi:hypothetical protein